MSPLRSGWLSLLVLVVLMVLTSMTTTLILTNRNYAKEPAKDWILVGNLTSTSITFRIRSGAHTLSVTADDSTNIAIDLSGDASVIQAISILDLVPATRYSYQVETTNVHVLSGTFQTPQEGPFDFTVVTGGCAWTGSEARVFNEMAKEDPLFVLHLGDFHYEDIGVNNVEKRLDAIGTVLASQTQANLFRSTALVSIWDDHDWLGNNAGRDDEQEEGARETALASYGLAFPHYPLAAATEESVAVPIYHAFTMGTIRFVISDLRSESTSEAIYSDQQKEWLRAELSLAANYDFVVWVTTKPWIGEYEEGEDSWYGQGAVDRVELSDWISDTIGASDGPQNLIAVSADAHMVAFDDGTNTYYGNSSEARLSFPILQSGPLDRLGSAKGGPFTEGCTSIEYERNHQYSTLSFEVSNRDEPCIQIRTYQVKQSSKEEIFSKRLCGKLFQPSRTLVKEGSCEIDSFSSTSIALMSVVAAITVFASLVACCFFERRLMFVVVGIVWFGFVLTVVVGVGIPLVQNIHQYDILPVLIISLVQSVLVCCYILGWIWRRRRGVDKAEQELASV